MTLDMLEAYTRVRDPKNYRVSTDGTGDYTTIAAAIADGKIRPGADVILLNGASRFFEYGLIPASRQQFGAYGTGRPIVDGSTLIPAADWTVNGTYANVFQYTATQDIASNQPYYPMLWWGDAGVGAEPADCRATSTTSLTISTGTQALMIETGKAFQVGDPVRIKRASDRTKYMNGLVTGYSGGTLTVNVLDTVGSGTFTDWVISLTSAMRGYWGGTAIADNVAYVAAHPGTFTCHVTGSTAPNPASPLVAATSIDYFLNPLDGENPATSGVPIYFGQHKNIFQLFGGHSLSDFTVQRTSTKDMITAGSSNEALSTSNMHLLDASCHCVVYSPANHVNGYGRGLPEAPVVGGYGWHFFRDSSGLGSSDPCSATNCVAENIASGFGSHGTGGPPPNVSVHLLDCESRECPDAVDAGGFSGDVGIWTVENFVRVNSPGGYFGDAGNYDLINSP